MSPQTRIVPTKAVYRPKPKTYRLQFLHGSLGLFNFNIHSWTVSGRQCQII